MRSVVIFTGSYFGVRVKEDEIGRSRGTHCRLHIYEVLLSAQEKLRSLGLFSEIVNLLSG
jgi:hypothetical protein